MGIRNGYLSCPQLEDKKFCKILGRCAWINVQFRHYINLFLLCVFYVSCIRSKIPLLAQSQAHARAAAHRKVNMINSGVGL
mmetsp:Transcript_37191/g.79031  ORF Transcript_37191/g.79031 Transcript_37191/m.79031 type:complete len:81 (+) Transcript_37191:579-821(+)